MATNAIAGAPRAVTDGDMILASAEIDASPERVFQALTSTETETWWGAPDTYLIRDWRADLQVGGRYSHNSQTATQTTAGALVGATSYTQPSSENVFTYSLAPKIKFGERAAFYARVAKGFRPGGPNALAPGAPAIARSYQSDETVNYEVGFKAQTSDRKF